MKIQPLYKQLLSRRAVLQAMEEYDRDKTAFLDRYGYGEADTYFLRHEGRAYASKAILGVAYGYQYPDRGPLKHDQFSGGKAGAARHLSMLGFHVDGIDRESDDWKLQEVQTVVSEYFRLYRLQIEGSYSRKRDFSQTLAAIPTRNESSISRKFSNIAAILAEAQLPLVKGFSPLGNKQTLLAAVIYDWVRESPEAFDTPLSAASLSPSTPAGVEVPPPSVIRVARTAKERKAVRVDFAVRDERNRRLGKAGEEWALRVLKLELVEAGRPDLAERVTWISDKEGDGLGYDIASFARNGDPLAVEVKTTNGGHAAPFIVTEGEVRASEEESGYVLMRIFDFSQNPRFYRLEGSLRKNCTLRPLAFSAFPTTEEDGLPIEF
ncbi:DUF3883 domain-containing protein [Caulobacter sp. CCH9-E1]|uniref:DUF3883 domain-containing protein n=1 Tax=Caulobacter sp. CCH9-E1 TaxID=1768768 RepID=UPI0009E7F2AD|nr:DUF3883 domain-containing protein [Caulobacter sp. CCH9-E1]